jgi:2-dehydropantoate 2-reductase
MTEIEKTIAILGAGPVGSILGACLTKTGHKVVLVDSSEERCRQIERHGVVITGRMTMSGKPLAVLRSAKELQNYEPMALFICTKTWTLKTLIPELVTSLHADALVISFQNGIGTEDELGQHFARHRVARGIVNYAGGVAADSGDVTMQWFKGPNYLGPLDDGNSPRLQYFASTLSDAGLATEAIPSNQTKRTAFYKTILNSALNALCATSGITMKQAMTYAHTRSLADMLIREGLSVASAVGYSYGENAREMCLKYLDQGGDHLPSMWFDLQRKCPTEIEYINGKIVKVGHMFKNIDVDVNLFFTSMIITEEIKSGVRKPDDIPEYLTHR